MLNPNRIERETVEHYLARGGRITRVPPSMPADLLYVTDQEAVDLALGATYDDLYGTGVSRFHVSTDMVSAIQESTNAEEMTYAE